MIAVGAPRVVRAEAIASSTASMSWPSICTVFHRRRDPAGVRVQVPAVPGGAALAEPVDVEDRGEVVEPFDAGLLERLPHRALGQPLSPHSTQVRYGRWSSRLAAIATPTPMGRPWPSEPVATSTQGSRGWVALQAAAELCGSGEQFLLGDGAGGLVGGVQQR